MSCNEALNDEVEALTSIYDSAILSVVDANSKSGTTNAVLALPNVPYSFALTFSHSYPEEPPHITGTHHVADSTRKGEGEAAATILRDVLGGLFTPGQVCLFDLVEEATPLLTQHHEAQNGTSQDCEEHTTDRSATPQYHDPAMVLESPLTAANASTTAPSIAPPDWISSATQVSKSRFVARCLAVKSSSEATDSISHLLSTNKKVASATHNITAWRIKTQQGKDAPEIVVQDSDDDGETAAGGRLLHLMQLMDVWNVVVIVTRWYGGVKLGPDRFRCINAVAREALVAGGFVKEEKETAKSSKKSKK